MQKSNWPVIDTCAKCGTENSEVFEYHRGYFICRSNGCWDEETERDSGRHIIKNRQLEDYKKLIARSQG